jgi:predicted amidohydrolase YtcJ
VTAARAFRHGRIWTGRRFVESLLAEEGRVVAVGTDDEVRRLLPQAASVVEFQGRLVVPGFLDAHLHLSSLVLRGAGVDLRGCRSFQEAEAAVRRWSQLHPRGPIWGGGLDDERLTERRLPDRAELDRWAADRPMTLSRVCEHIALLNSAGLTELGLSRNVPDPPGGSFGRDAAGELSGLVSERALGVLERFPFPSLEERPELGRGVLRDLAALGLVGVASLRASLGEVRWARAQAAAPGLPRYFAFGRSDSLEEIESWGRYRRSGDPALLGVKLVADGSFGARTAWLQEPYTDRPELTGAPVFPKQQWEEAIRAAESVELRVAAHALGDMGLRTLLDGLERATPSRRPRIEHAGLVPPALAPRLRATGADVVLQPGFRRSDRWLADRLGPARLPSAYRFAELVRSGVNVAGSSDAPIEPADPFDGLRCAVASGPLGQSLTPLEALQLYHGGAARSLDAPELGHLEIGASASLVWLEATGIGELFEASSPPVRGTWIDGVPALGPPPQR